MPLLRATMVRMSGLHHRHLRKRIYVNLEKYPHPDFFKRALDVMVYVVGFLGPAFTIPQIWGIYAGANASGVSALTWGAYALFDIVWIVYGIVHKERIITFTYVLWLIMNGVVAVGALIYG